MRQKAGLSSILDSAFPIQNLGNTSDPKGPPMTTFSPTSVLESFIPGYGHIHKVFLHTFGIDVTVLVSVVAALLVSVRIWKTVGGALWSFISSCLLAEITVSSSDEIHGHLMQFLAQKYKTNSSRKLMAETLSKSAWELDNEEAEAPDTPTDEDGNTKWLNFSNQEAKSQPRFTPAVGGAHNFWHNGRYYQLRRKEVNLFNEMGNGAASFKEKESLTLSCFGRSTEPIKQLLQHAKAHYHLGHRAKTVIKRPAPKEMRRFGGRGSWVKIAERPCRPMKTVVLDEGRKMDVLADINEYLNPATARWYSNRGIPYRRGYLFYGPPGTGKTSLTFALAGVFGLDIHVVSLLEPTLTEEELGMLFTNLPARCIVLLEDIDTAGLIRNLESETEEMKVADGENNKREFDVRDLTKAFRKASQQTEEDRKKGISLSGLLNIIDGVASHEGRVLVMTTNHPEKLDEALIRPGRVDHQVPFTHATQVQIKELFERMYTNDLPRSKLPFKSSSTISFNIKIKSDEITPPPTPSASCEKGPEITEDELSDIAAEFAKRVPDGMFSPAEIQGFLLKRKTAPREALGEVKGWVEGMREVRDRGGVFNVVP